MRRHARWTWRALIGFLTLAAALAACAPAASTSRPAPGAPLAAMLVSSVTPSTSQIAAGFSTLHIEALNPGDGAVRWSYPASWRPQHVAAAPVVANGVVYAVSDSPPANPATQEPTGDLVALSERDGRRLWSATVGYMSAAPVVANGIVYTTGLSGDSAGQPVTSFYAFNADTGQRIWRTDLTAQEPLDQGFGTLDTIQFANGTLYIRSNQVCFDQCQAAYVLALRASNGKRLWKVTDPGNITIPSPTVAGASMYVIAPNWPFPLTGAGGGLTAYNISDGSARWNVPAEPGGEPLIAGDTVYATLTARNQPDNPASALTIVVRALDAATGTTRWTYTASASAKYNYRALLATTADTVYVQSQSSDGAYSLAALDPKDGGARWHASLPQRLTIPMLCGSTLTAWRAISTGRPAPSRWT